MYVDPSFIEAARLIIQAIEDDESNNRIVIRKLSPQQEALKISDALIVAATLAEPNPTTLWPLLRPTSVFLLYTPTLAAMEERDRVRIRNAVAEKQVQLDAAAQKAARQLLAQEKTTITKPTKGKRQGVVQGRNRANNEGTRVRKKDEYDEDEESSTSSDSDEEICALKSLDGNCNPGHPDDVPAVIDTEEEPETGDWIPVKKRTPKLKEEEEGGLEVMAQGGESIVDIALQANPPPRHQAQDGDASLRVQKDQQTKQTASVVFDPEPPQRVPSEQTSSHNNLDILDIPDDLKAKLDAERQENARLRTQLMEKDASLQALQLRLYIAETRLSTYEEALKVHVDTVAENVVCSNSSSGKSLGRVAHSRVID